MNYRHSFHAGNFADLVKHAALLWLLAAVQERGPGLTVVDTHAGAGLYDLTVSDQARSREAEAGIARLTDAAPPPLRPLREAVAALNGGPVAKAYPGSPRLVAERLRNGDRYVGYDLVPGVVAALRQAVRAFPAAEAREGDGFARVVGTLGRGSNLVLIDPPFERPTDYADTAAAMAAIARADSEAVQMAWLPLKDLETLDGFVRRLEGFGLGGLVAEARLRPLMDPMKMNGCALALIRAPTGTEAAVGAICEAVVTTLGETGGRARTWPFG